MFWWETREHGALGLSGVFLCLVGLFSSSCCFFFSETVKSGIVAAEYGEDDSDPEDDINDKFTDLSIMACLLCKRQFPNKEALERHQKFSDLHKVIMRLS